MPPSAKKALKYIYSDEYREQIFYFWYKNRHLGPDRFNMKVPLDENNQKVTLFTVKQWAYEYGWDERAQALDLETINRMDNIIIDERIQMFREHAEIGKEIKDLGIAYLREHGIEKDMSALRAIADGIQIERSSRGLADSLARLAQMDDAALLKEINKMLKYDKSAIDVDYEDVTPPDEDSE